mmetsp:Transcript_66659/g.100459  ORF Transcript_66659/g.100459 Transcript_66659/m.100459 type:complete len:286 (+) Transcript_66659:1130-1987(+)
MPVAWTNPSRALLSTRSKASYPSVIFRINAAICFDGTAYDISLIRVSIARFPRSCCIKFLRCSERKVAVSSRPCIPLTEFHASVSWADVALERAESCLSMLDPGWIMVSYMEWAVAIADSSAWCAVSAILFRKSWTGWKSAFSTIFLYCTYRCLYDSNKFVKKLGSSRCLSFEKRNNFFGRGRPGVPDMSEAEAELKVSSSFVPLPLVGVKVDAGLSFGLIFSSSLMSLASSGSFSPCNFRLTLYSKSSTKHSSSCSSWVVKCSWFLPSNIDQQMKSQTSYREIC